MAKMCSRHGNRYLKVKISNAVNIRFKCIRCDFCCGTGPNIALTVFDVVRMARFLRMHWREFVKRYVKVIVADVVPFLSLRGDERGRCLFLYYKPSGETVCTIYPARPMRCRLYPVLVEELRADVVYVDTACPGVGQGSPLKVPHRLVEQYVWERREHYRRLFRLVVEEGLHPLEALERVLEEAWREAEEGARWADLDYIEGLGSV